MHLMSTNFAIADYCIAMERKEIVVNRAYQRSDKVWPAAARSFLIESILLGYPIPKLFLYQIMDVKSRKTVKEIVDGQQRSQAILDFHGSKLQISRSSDIPEVAGKFYSQLDEEYQQRFLNYSLAVDLFLSVTPDEIREAFRRINSYTVPLNPEENRHALYQGEFKWFIYRLSKTYDQTFVNLGVFSEKQLVRMADTKLFAEIVHAILYGITTTDIRTLNKLYEYFDGGFDAQGEMEARIEQAMTLVLDLEEIHKGSLMKPYNFYALVLAIVHFLDPLETLMPTYELPIALAYDRSVAVTNLTNLAESLEYPETPGRFKQFVDANLSKTNVAAHRNTRFQWFCKALQRNPI